MSSRGCRERRPRGHPSTVHGVHNGDHLDLAATDTPFAMPAMHVYRGAGDRLAEQWGVRDELSVLIQVGAIARPQPFDLSGLVNAGGGSGRE